MKSMIYQIIHRMCFSNVYCWETLCFENQRLHIKWFLTQREACWSGWRPLVTNCFLIQGVRKYVSKCNVGAWPQRPPSCRPISSVHRELSINADCTGSDTTLRYPALPLVRRGHVTTSPALWLASLATWPYHWALVGQPPDGACKLPQRMQLHLIWSCTLTLRITCCEAQARVRQGSARDGP